MVRVLVLVLSNSGSHNCKQDTIDELFTDLQFMQHVPPIVKHLLWTEADDGTKTDGAAYRLFYSKWGTCLWLTGCAPDLVAYLPQDLHDHHLYYRTSRAWSPIGQPTDTNSLETYNRTYKSPEMFDSVEGIEPTSAENHRIPREP